MCKHYLFLFVLVSTVCLSFSAPPPITKCKAEDSKCITDNANAIIPVFTKGIPELKVETLDPVFIKSINASEGNLLFIVSDATIKGMEGCKAIKLTRDKATENLKLNIVCSATLDGHYQLKGSLLFVPIEGDGRIFVDLKVAEFNINVNLDEKMGEDGKAHWHIKSWSHTFDLKEKSDVVFENLYNGNEILGRAARELVKNNGNDIIKEIGPKVIKAMVQRVVKNINHFFKYIPAEDLALD